RNAYKGEVPISPKTTPTLPSVNAQKPLVFAEDSSLPSAVGSLTAMVSCQRSDDDFDPGLSRTSYPPVNHRILLTASPRPARPALRFRIIRLTVKASSSAAAEAPHASR